MASQPFDSLAPQYDGMNDLISGGLHRLWRRTLCRALSRGTGPRPLRLLDVATGTGDLADRAKRLHPHWEVWALDPSLAMMREGQRRGRRADLWLHAESEAIPLPEASVDLLTCGFGVRNFRGRARAFAEWHRVLRPGGRAFVLEIHPPPRSWRLMRFYWSRVMPWIGGRLTHPDAYTYLRDTSEAFIDAAALAREIEAQGFRLLSSRGLWAAGMLSLSVYEREGQHTAP